MFLLDPASFIWDLLIVLVISIGLCMLVCTLLWQKRHPNAHTIQKGGVSTFGIIGVCVIALTIYGSFIEPRMVTVTEHSIEISSEEPWKAVVISDLHIGNYTSKAHLEKVVNTVNQQLPDAVFIAGDIIDNEASDLSIIETLSSIRASAGVFAVLGNHDRGHRRNMQNQRIQFLDRGNDVEDALRNAGVTILRNAYSIISLGTENVILVGIDDLWSGDTDLASALNDIPEDMRHLPTVLLSHNPDIITDRQTHTMDLVIAGHTHGGQIRLPHLGALTSLPTQIGPTFDQGVFDLDSGSKLAISRGVGTTSVRARLFAWPEVMVLNLQ